MYIRAKLETKCPKGIKVPSSEIRTLLGSNPLVFGLFLWTKKRRFCLCVTPGISVTVVIK